MISKHFFQPLLPGFLSNFSIPKSFLKNLQEGKEKDNNTKIVKLRDKQGRIWEIKVDCEGLKFKSGWENFCKHYALQIGDFLVFKHLGNFVFCVIIFDSTCCERKFPFLHQPTSKASTSNACPISSIDGIHKNGKKGLKKIEDIHKACSAAKATFKPRGLPYWRTFVKPSTLTWGGMPIPADFAKEHDLANNCGEVIILDERGKTWQLSLRKYKRSVYIGRWSHFHKHNGLSAGDCLTFELITSGELPVMKFYRTVS